MVESILDSSGIVIKYVSGVTQEGKDIVKSQTYNNIRSNMTDEDIFAVSKALMSLMEDNIVSLRKTLAYTLMEH